MEDVAAAAHVTKPMVYRHFDSKKDLYLALLAPPRGRPADVPRGRRLSSQEGDEPIRAMLDVWLDYVRANSHAWAMLFRDNSGGEEIQAARLRVSATARRVMAAFIAERAGRAHARRAGGAHGRADHQRPRRPGDVVDRPARGAEGLVVDVAARMSAPALT